MPLSHDALAQWKRSPLHVKWTSKWQTPRRQAGSILPCAQQISGTGVSRQRDATFGNFRVARIKSATAYSHLEQALGPPGERSGGIRRYFFFFGGAAFFLVAAAFFFFCFGLIRVRSMMISGSPVTPPTSMV